MKFVTKIVGFSGMVLALIWLMVWGIVGYARADGGAIAVAIIGTIAISIATGFAMVITDEKTL
jgi:hypothetical protein